MRPCGLDSSSSFRSVAGPIQTSCVLNVVTVVVDIDVAAFDMFCMVAMCCGLWRCVCVSWCFKGLVWFKQAFVRARCVGFEHMPGWFRDVLIRLTYAPGC
eukprot:4301317-Pyramimonas_sp.AAC.1